MSTPHATDRSGTSVPKNMRKCAVIYHALLRLGAAKDVLAAVFDAAFIKTVENSPDFATKDAITAIGQTDVIRKVRQHRGTIEPSHVMIFLKHNGFKHLTRDEINLCFNDSTLEKLYLKLSASDQTEDDRDAILGPSTGSCKVLFDVSAGLRKIRWLFFKHVGFPLTLEGIGLDSKQSIDDLSLFEHARAHQIALLVTRDRVLKDPKSDLCAIAHAAFKAGNPGPKILVLPDESNQNAGIHEQIIAALPAVGRLIQDPQSPHIITFDFDPGLTKFQKQMAALDQSLG